MRYHNTCNSRQLEPRETTFGHELFINPTALLFEIHSDTVYRMPHKLLTLAFLITLYPLRVEGAEIRIGVIAPLSGAFAFIGEEIQRTVTLREQTLREIYPTLSVRFIVEDGTCGIGSNATTAAKKLLFVDRVQFLLTGCSGETLLAAPLAEKQGVITVAAAANHPGVKALGPFTYRTFLDSERGIGQVVTELREKNLLPVAIISEENSFTQGIKKLFETLLPMSLAASEDFAPNETDFRTAILRIRKENPKSLYLNCATPQTCARLVVQLKQLRNELPLYSYYYMDHPSFIDATGDAGHGMRYLGTPTIEHASAAYKAFFHNYQRQFSVTPLSDYISRSSFDALSVMLDATAAVGTGADNLRKYIDNYDKPGALGRVWFDETGDIRELNYELKTFLPQPR